MRSVITVIVSIFLVGCAGESAPDVDHDIVSVATSSVDGLQIEMLAGDALEVGWNEVYYRVVDEQSGDLVVDASIAQAPWMQMDDAGHACPFTDPTGGADADGLFAGEMVFIMASGPMAGWTNEVTATIEGVDHTVIFDDMSVAETDRKKNLVFSVGEQEHVYIVTLTPLADEVVGQIPFVLTVHERETPTLFPSIADLNVSFEPFMPDMAHGSNGNVMPAYVDNGRYEGVMAFSMSGYWEVDFVFADGATELGTVRYTFEL